MFLFKALLIIAIFHISTAVNSQWSQCGGETWTSTSDCVSGYTCYVQDRYYSQCRPNGDCPSGWNCSVYVPPPVNNNTNAISAWGQCGGQNWNSNSNCVYGYVCYVQDQWYAQCRPNGDCPSNWNCTINGLPNNNNNNNSQIGTWGQCGGKNWNSAGLCSNNDVCYIENDYYSQCRPAGDCPINWLCTNQTNTPSSNSISTTTHTPSNNQSCSLNQFYNTQTFKCQDKGNYAKYCKSNNQCKSELGLICTSHKYYCNCPLSYVGYHYCDCDSFHYYSYSVRKCVSKLSYGSYCHSNYQCKNYLGLQCRSHSCVCWNSKFYKWNGKKCNKLN